MKSFSFVGIDNNILTDLQIKPKEQANVEKYPNFKPLVFILLFAILVYGVYYHTKNSDQEDMPPTKKYPRLETLIQKAISNENLTEHEWSELCQLLSTEKSLNINDCENCRDYLRALLGGRHKTHLIKYMERTDKELQKGIKSYQKQIDEHIDKIANPEKYIPNWNNLHPNQKKVLQEEKWYEDIQRQREQKQILECILKNRRS